MFFSIICSKRITVVQLSPSVGIVTTRGRTDGTCTVAKSMVPFFFLSINSAPMLSERLRINGKGLEESTAIGVRTGKTSF